jgi:hypothetical protein
MMQDSRKLTWGELPNWLTMLITLGGIVFAVGVFSANTNAQIRTLEDRQTRNEREVAQSVELIRGSVESLRVSFIDRDRETSEKLGRIQGMLQALYERETGRNYPQ